jgi:plastocyanin
MNRKTGPLKRAASVLTGDKSYMMPANSGRRPFKILSRLLATLLSLGALLAAVMNLPPAQAQRSAVTPLTPADGGDVAISGFAFNPADIRITAGTVVTWTNLDLTAHTTTSAAGSVDPWDSGSLSQGGVFTRTFSALGTYAYRCLIHPDMTGTVIVAAYSYLPLVQR